MESSPLSFLRVLFDEAMLRNIRKCTVVEARCISDKINWDVTLDKLDKFIGLISARGTLRREICLWKVYGSQLGCFRCSTTLYLETDLKKIMRFLRFNVKSDRR